MTAESRSEHPVAKAILKKTSNMAIFSEEPEKFDFTPGKGIVAARRGIEVIVGNRFFLEGHRVALPVNAVSPGTRANCSLPKNFNNTRFTRFASKAGGLDDLLDGSILLYTYMCLMRVMFCTWEGIGRHSVGL
jgi:hypothetical protein